DLGELDRPDELKNISEPIIGYIGSISSVRLDINIIKNLAVNNPEWTIVLVGPQDEEFKESDIHRIKNIFFIGPKAIKDLPAYIKSFDVCINPQTLNILTIGNYPRKIDEYLAVGKPVVATATEAMKEFEDYVFLAR